MLLNAIKGGNKMNNALMQLTLEGLLKTALEKVFVLGSLAKPEVDRLKETYDDMADFWELDTDDESWKRVYEELATYDE
jgi:hypothetical protein